MHLFEFGDLDWIPSKYHFYLRKILTKTYKTFGFHPLWTNALEEFIKQEKSTNLIEYCAGDGNILQRGPHGFSPVQIDEQQNLPGEYHYKRQND